MIFRINYLNLLAVQGTLKNLLQHHSSKASILWCSAFFTVQLSHPYMTTGKTIAWTRWTFVGKVMSLLLNMLSRLVITVLPRSKHLLISWLQSPSVVILEPPKIKSHPLFPLFPHLFPMKWWDQMPWSSLSECWANFFILLFHFHQEAFEFLFTFCHEDGVICQNAVLGCNLKSDTMILVHFQDKPFNITVIEIYTPTTDANEANVNCFYEDLQGLLELTSKKMSFSS